MLPQSCWWHDFYWFFQLFSDTTKSKGDLNFQFCYSIFIDYMTIVSKGPAMEEFGEETLLPVHFATDSTPEWIYVNWLVVMLKWSLGQVKIVSY